MTDKWRDRLIQVLRWPNVRFIHEGAYLIELSESDLPSIPLLVKGDDDCYVLSDHEFDRLSICIRIKRDRCFEIFEYWTHNRKLSRLNGPAKIIIQRRKTIQEWWVWGARHRDDGPAVIESIYRDDDYDQIGTLKWQYFVRWNRPKHRPIFVRFEQVARTFYETGIIREMAAGLCSVTFNTNDEEPGNCYTLSITNFSESYNEEGIRTERSADTLTGKWVIADNQIVGNEQFDLWVKTHIFPTMEFHQELFHTDAEKVSALLEWNRTRSS